MRPNQRIECLDRLRDLLAEPGDDGTAIARRARSAVALSDVLSSPDMSAEVVAVALEQIVDVDQLVGAEPMEGWIQTTALFGLLCADRFARVDDILSTAGHERRPPPTPLVQRRISALSAISLLWQGSLVAADDECTRTEEGQDRRSREPSPLR